MLVPTGVLAAPAPGVSEPAGNANTPPSPKQASEFTVRIQISSRLGADNRAVQEMVLERLTEVALEQGVTVDENAEQLLYLVIKRENDGEATFHMELAYTREGAGTLLREPNFACKGCGAGSLLDKIADTVRPVFSNFKQKAAPKVAPKPVQPKVVQAPAPKEPEGPPRGLGMWGAGIVLTALGASATVGGALGLGITSADPEFKGNPALSWGALGGGVVALGVGVPLLILGGKRMRRGKRRARASAMYDGRMIALGLRGSF